jgi:hypothetical protein
MSDIEHTEITEAARRLANQRRMVEGKCKVCGTTFIGTRKKKFCSHTCAQRDYYARHSQVKEQLREETEG